MIILISHIVPSFTTIQCIEIELWPINRHLLRYSALASDNLGNYCWNTFEPLVKMNPLSPLFNVARSHFIITRAGSPNIDWWGWGRDMS